MNKLLLSALLSLVSCVTASTVFAQDIKGNAAAGEKKNAMCVGCHSIVGYQASFPEIHKVPKIAGQSEKHIIAALNAYKTGERKHASMRGIAGSLTDQDIADLAAYFSNAGVVKGAAPLPPAAPATGSTAELLTRGNCASCHGASLSAPIDPSYPKIAGQYSDYLFVALKSYKIEGNSQIGRSNAVMGAIAKQFSTAELKQLAAYVGSLPGELKTVPEKPFK